MSKKNVAGWNGDITGKICQEENHLGKQYSGRKHRVCSQTVRRQSWSKQNLRALQSQ